MGLACSASSKNRQAHPVKLSEEDERKAKQIQANLIKAMEDFLKILKDSEDEFKNIIAGVERKQQ